MTGVPSDRKAIAVFDLGKTNSKLLVFSSAGAVVFEARTQPAWRTERGLRVLDDAKLERWMRDQLAIAVADHGVGHVMISAHGCTFALVRGRDLVHPILDYEQEPPSEVAEAIDRHIPGFAETFSPRLPLGFNYGRHLLWLDEAMPGLLDRTEAILAYPQFWAWRLCGKPVAEVSYLGCHSHLWAPLKDDFSSLVDARGWRGKMPAFARAGAVLGECAVELGNGRTERVVVHNGVHDSNASLYYYASSDLEDFTLVSTGTWVVIFNPECPLEELDPGRDMLANVTVDHQPVATARFMGGREFDVASAGRTSGISMESLAAVIQKEIFALPAFAVGGPFPWRTGEIVGPAATPEERSAAALLYVVMMCDTALDLVRSDNPLIIDGGLLRAKPFAGLLAGLRRQRPVFASANTEGSSLGAAVLAFESLGARPISAQPQPVAPTPLPGLACYRAKWRKLARSGRLRRSAPHAASMPRIGTD